MSGNGKIKVEHLIRNSRDGSKTGLIFTVFSLCVNGYVYTTNGRHERPLHNTKLTMKCLEHFIGISALKLLRNHDVCITDMMCINRSQSEI